MTNIIVIIAIIECTTKFGIAFGVFSSSQNQLNNARNREKNLKYTFFAKPVTSDHPINLYGPIKVQKLYFLLLFQHSIKKVEKIAKIPINIK